MVTQTPQSVPEVNMTEGMQTDLTDPRWALHVTPAGYLLLERLTSYYTRLTQQGAELLLLSARMRDVKSIRNAFEAVHGPSDKTLVSLEENEFIRLWRCGLLPQIIPVTGSRNVYVPLNVTLQLTNRCNLKCGFCYASSGPSVDTDGELSTVEWLELIEQMATRGTVSMTLTGGEPTIHPDFPALLTCAATHMVSVSVFSNGARWRPEWITLAANMGNVDVQISLDGMGKTHDQLRQVNGSFARALKSITELAESGIHVSVAMTVNPQNAGEVGDVCTAVLNAGASRFRPGVIREVGRAAKSSKWLLTDETLTKIQHILDGMSISFPEQTISPVIRCGSGTSASGASEDGRAPEESCTPGYLSWYVMANGDVTPCQLEGQTFGNVRKEDVSTLGTPEQLANMKQVAVGCACMSNTAFDETSELPLFQA